MKEDLNFKAIGKNVLIDLARKPAGKKSGIIMAEQTNKGGLIQLDDDEAFEIISISKAVGEEYGVEIGMFVYLTPGVGPLIKFETDTIYGLIDAYEICGIAPNGFNKEEHNEKKEEEKKRIKEYAQKTRDAARLEVIGGTVARTDKDMIVGPDNGAASGSEGGPN